MKKLFENWDEDNTTYLFIVLFLSLLLGLFIKQITADHSIKSYYLSGNMDGSLKIMGEVNWAEDDKIILDRSVTYEEAIKMVNDLNATLLYDGD